MAAGHDNFGPSIRNYKMAVDKRSVDGKDKVCVTIPSEAFGLLVFANCRTKWVAIFKFKQESPTADIPLFDEEDSNTHVYHTTLWSDSKSGQIKGGGWDSDAYLKLNFYMTKIHVFRSKDQKAEWKIHALAKDFVREKNGITAVAQTNKRKRKNKEAKAEPLFVEILAFDEL